MIAEGTEVSRIEDSMGITYRQLNYWQREGYLRPVTSVSGRNEWPEIEIRIGRMMSRLVAIGITPSRAAFYARSAIEDKTPMLLEFRGGKLIIRGPFARAVKQSLIRQQRERDLRSYHTA